MWGCGVEFFVLCLVMGVMIGLCGGVEMWISVGDFSFLIGG